MMVASRGLPRLVVLKDAKFYNEYPSNLANATTIKPTLGPLNFVLQKPQVEKDIKIHAKVQRKARTWIARRPHYAVIGSDPTPFLRVLKGDFIAVPPTSRQYPYLSSEDARLHVPSEAIKYVGFNSPTKGGQGVQGAYLSARYESRREETDWTLEQYLKGQTELNPAEEAESPVNKSDLTSISQSLDLERLLEMPVSQLSNGQTRRSRIAKALLDEPELLLLDQPFMGLDPPTTLQMSRVLRKIAYSTTPPALLLGLRPQDPIPHWITHLVILSSQNEIIVADDKMQVMYLMSLWARGRRTNHEIPAEVELAKALSNKYNELLPPISEPLILTRYGVRTFHRPGSRFRHFKTEEGFWKPDESLQLPLREIQNSAHEKAPKDRSVEDWIALTGTLSHALHIQLRNDFYVLNKDAGQDEETSPKTLDTNLRQHGEPLVEFSNIVVKYADRTVLGHAPPGLNLNINRGSRILLLGPNGSGKTTFLSLLNSDHPQSYSLPIKFFGRTRLASPGKPGLSVWEIQSRIGHSSPEVHAFFPKHFTVRQTLESAWAETFSSKPVLDNIGGARVDRMLKYWALELCQDKKLWVDDIARNDLRWASDKEHHPRFGALPFATQRLLLLLRAIIKSPDIVILDEAFSGFSSVLRDRALNFLEHGYDSGADQLLLRPVDRAGINADQALIVVSHVKEEIPYSIDEFVRLPGEAEAQAGKPVITGRANDVRTEQGWSRIWGL